jgi:hypothetical protein
MRCSSSERVASQHGDHPRPARVCHNEQSTGWHAHMSVARDRCALLQEAAAGCKARRFVGLWAGVLDGQVEKAVPLSNFGLSLANRLEGSDATATGDDSVLSSRFEGASSIQAGLFGNCSTRAWRSLVFRPPLANCIAPRNFQGWEASAHRSVPLAVWHGWQGGYGRWGFWNLRSAAQSPTRRHIGRQCWQFEGEERPKRA